MTHTISIGPSAAKIVDGNGRVSPLPKPRASTFRARCSCGWRGPERSTADQASTDGESHASLSDRGERS